MSASNPQPTDVPDISDTQWRLDPRRSSVGFETKAFWGLQTVKGQFLEFEGTLHLQTDPAIDLSVRTDSLTTGNTRRDKHLLSADFLDAAESPLITFTSTQLTLGDDTLAMRGRLTAAQGTIPMELEATIRQEEGDLLLDGSTFVDHRELGMTWNRLGMIGPKTKLVLHARLTSV
jgi:polyisoprenoid-binding protein YceI